MIGTVLAGRYKIAGVLGSGGMGVVYRADDLTLGEMVALKVLIAGDRGGFLVERLLDEVRLARKVGHPNVCRVHDVGQADGLLFISMEYIEGSDLESLIKSNGRLSSDRALEIGIQVAEGLAAIHAQKVLHLDLKPANLMIDPDTGVKITDFGIAGKAGDGARGGTPVYMPPEQQDGSASEASDLYALGLVLYELATGRRPFSGPVIEVTIQHREVVPTPPSALVDNIDPRVERLILWCLEKDPVRRPSSAQEVAALLIKARVPAEIGVIDPIHSLPVVEENGSRLTSGRLRTWPAAELPDHPYPVLLPYTHSQLLGGRRRELGELLRMLRLQTGILGFHAASGVGKSSLLMGGLVPWLKAAGWPVAYTRYPWEPDLADRLLGDLVETNEGDENIGYLGFGDAVTEVAHLCEEVPVLVIDQAEELLIRPDARRARAIAGVMLAATAQRRPGLNGPPCHWVLSYRQEYHGEIVSWLSDVLSDARAEGFDHLDGLPDSLDGADRFYALSLDPLGAPAPGADPLEEATSIFLEVIEGPLKLTNTEGEPQYPLRFAPGHAVRLAEAFARTRLACTEAPLTPELQVVLAHLQAKAGKEAPPHDGDQDQMIEVQVPAEPDSLIAEALQDHLQRSLEAAFPPGLRGAAQGRARALLALRELSHTAGRRQEGLSTAALARAIGESGEQILERLSASDTRLVVQWEHPEGIRWVLSHDRMAEAVVHLVDSEGQHGGLLVDTELLALRRVISLESALYELQGEAPERVDRKRSRQIEAHKDALLFDEPRRSWWGACEARQRGYRRRIAVWAVVMTVALGLMAAGTWRWSAARAELRGLYEQVSGGEFKVAFAAFEELCRRPEIDDAHLLELIEKRTAPLELLEFGLSGVSDRTRAQMALKAVEVTLPLVYQDPKRPAVIAIVVWALDYALAHDPALADKALLLRNRVLEPLRRLRPPPLQDEDWVHIKGGVFLMGSGSGDGRDNENMMDERPRHEVTLSPFRLLNHEVTNAEYRRLMPDHEGDDNLPALLNWYKAYQYAAWLGGRLPTEAEWEYAARADCKHVWCNADGGKATISQVAWWQGNSTNPSILEPELKPVMQLEPNPWGLYDMLGNLHEWTMDWYGEYPAEAQVNPTGAIDHTERVSRGSHIFGDATWVLPAGRETSSPMSSAACRVLLPGVSDEE